MNSYRRASCKCDLRLASSSTKLLYRWHISSLRFANSSAVAIWLRSISLHSASILSKCKLFFLDSLSKGILKSKRRNLLVLGKISWKWRRETERQKIYLFNSHPPNQTSIEHFHEDILHIRLHHQKNDICCNYNKQ